MKVLVVGAGMYVTGRAGTGNGTVLCSLAEASRSLPIEEVTVVARNPENREVVAEAEDRINKTLGTSLRVAYEPVGGGTPAEVAAIHARERFRCAIVSVPDHLHFAYTRELLLQGVHCLVVKPLTPTLAEARELLKIQREKGLHAAVEFHKRFDETNLYVKRAISDGRLGKLVYFTVDFSQKITVPTDVFRSWADRSNIFQYLGVHYVDLIHFLTGFHPFQTMAVGTEGILMREGIGTFDSIHAMVLWRNPGERSDWFASQFSTNWIDPACSSAMSDQKYKVIGTLGRIESDQKNRGLELVHRDLGIQTVNPYFSEFLPDENGAVRFGGYGHRSIALFLRDVAELEEGRITVESLERTRPTIRQSLASTAVVDAVNRSLADRYSWKTIDDELP
jgi:predicted dehydrogenase